MFSGSGGGLRSRQNESGGRGAAKPIYLGSTSHLEPGPRMNKIHLNSIGSHVALSFPHAVLFTSSKTLGQAFSSLHL